MSGFKDINRESAIECVGKGWSGLINELYDAIPEDTKVVQVKEKFGGLRFYVDSATEEFNNLIDDCEKRSYTICEQCGKEGKIREDRAWILTLCDECNSK